MSNDTVPTAVARPTSRYEAVQRRSFELLEVAQPGDVASHVVDLTILALICLNVLGLILGTVPALAAEYGVWFNSFERLSVILFTLEYALRIWSAPCAPPFAGAVTGRLRYAGTPLAVIDLLAVLPFWLPLFGMDLRALRLARLFRLFRLAKLARYSVALQTFGRVIARKRGELVVALSIGGALLLIGSSLIYFAENAAQPDSFSSIPAAMWWGIMTLATVGYGDIYPITTMGRVLASVVAVLGVGMFALPAGLLGAAFMEEFEGRPRATEKRCPRCGERLD